jgi:hypothetical protein
MKQTAVECTNCHWIGNHDNLVVVMVDNQFNREDHTLYEEKVCPLCKTNEYLS